MRDYIEVNFARVRFHITNAIDFYGYFFFSDEDELTLRIGQFRNYWKYNFDSTQDVEFRAELFMRMDKARLINVLNQCSYGGPDSPLPNLLNDEYGKRTFPQLEDIFRVKSPRGKEIRQFRLVPIKRRA